MIVEKTIENIVNNFLRWKLPEDFNPDAGISFTPDFNVHTAHPMKHEPIGTNLFDAEQATKMITDIAEEELTNLSKRIEELEGVLERIEIELKVKEITLMSDEEIEEAFDKSCAENGKDPKEELKKLRDIINKAINKTAAN